MPHDKPGRGQRAAKSKMNTAKKKSGKTKMPAKKKGYKK